MNCPSCGLLNLSTADVCVYCKSPLEGLSEVGEGTGKKVIRWSDAKRTAAAVRGKTLSAGYSAQTKASDWREQLDLKLDRLKEKEGKSSDSKEKLLGEIRNREFARPSPRLNETENLFSSAPPLYHPLAQKTLEKLSRASQAETSPPQNPVSDTSQLSQPVDAEHAVPIARVQKAPRSEKVERIEINLNQRALPFDEAENSRFGVDEGLKSGLAAASLSLRVRAGVIDALFICGCILIFLMIVFFVPDFVFLSRSSLLGLSAVAVLITSGYLFLLTALNARTLGMDHEQLQVVSFDGKLPSLRESSLRAFGYFVSLGCFCLGFLWGVFDPQKLTWHDRISKTLIVSRNPQA